MSDFTMPSLGADMEEGTFVEWKVHVGDHVERGDVVCVIETQKGAVDVEIWESGTVTELVAKPDDVIPVGGVLARLSSGAVVSEAASGTSVAQPEVPVAAETTAAPALIPPSPVPSADRTRASPAARRRAEVLGIDIAGLAGSGPGGAVTLEDVERGAAARAPAAAPSGTDPMRAAIAAAMSRSKREIPHYYLGHEIRVDAAWDWLAQRNASSSLAERILFAAVELKAVALALREARSLNGHFRDGRFVPGAGIHVGVAVALRGGGLVAPALHDTDRLSLAELMAALQDLLRRARGGQLRSSELADATITVTNLGDLGVQAVFGVIHPPQVALVGLGRPALRPWVAEKGSVVAARTVYASLSADHRVSDGMGGARFLQELDHLLADPEALA